MSDPARPAEKLQKTQPKKGKPVEIPVPTRGQFDTLVKKVAGPVSGRKSPDEKDASAIRVTGTPAA